MIISHSKKFIFIHIYKVAGTSISTALRRYNHLPSKLNRLKSVLKIYPRVYSRDFNGHITAKELRRSIPNYFDQYFKFAFVRNPWDWQVSLYHFAKQNKEHHQHKLISKMNFEEYIDWRVHEDLHLQKDFINDDEDNSLVNFVGKFEQLQSDFQTICNHLTIKDCCLLHKKKSEHLAYQNYYSQKTKSIVEEAFRDDITLFKYSF